LFHAANGSIKGLQSGFSTVIRGFPQFIHIQYPEIMVPPAQKPAHRALQGFLTCGKI
jgi:hypothetical protein